MKRRLPVFRYSTEEGTATACLGIIPNLGQHAQSGGRLVEQQAGHAESAISAKDGDHAHVGVLNE